MTAALLGKPTASTISEAIVRVALTAKDRCDASAVVGTKGGGKSTGSCGAQAFVTAEMPNGGVLLFCGHHADKYEPALVIAKAVLIDERAKINLKPSGSA